MRSVLGTVAVIGLFILPLHGQLDDKERELLESYASKYRIPTERLDQLIAAARANDLDVPLPTDRNEARATLTRFLDAAAAAIEPQARERPLIVGGFSQGGMLACDMFLRAPRAGISATDACSAPLGH